MFCLTEKAFLALKEVKQYNYLLGMALWMLTKEKKDELLKQRDQKLADLNILKYEYFVLVICPDFARRSQRFYGFLRIT